MSHLRRSVCLSALRRGRLRNSAEAEAFARLTELDRLKAAPGPVVAKLTAFVADQQARAAAAGGGGGGDTDAAVLSVAVSEFWRAATIGLLSDTVSVSERASLHKHVLLPRPSHVAAVCALPLLLSTASP